MEHPRIYFTRAFSTFSHTTSNTYKDTRTLRNTPLEGSTSTVEGDRAHFGEFRDVGRRGSCVDALVIGNMRHVFAKDEKTKAESSLVCAEGCTVCASVAQIRKNSGPHQRRNTLEIGPFVIEPILFRCCVHDGMHVLSVLLENPTILCSACLSACVYTVQRE